MSTHTPGPWKQAMWGGRVAIIHDRTDNGTFDIVVACNDSAPTFADTRLIEAAPDLLKLVKDIANLDHYCLAHGDKTLIKDLRAWKMEARAAIAKAEGTS